MKNQAFTKKFTDEKMRHLSSVLRNCPSGPLDNKTIKRLLRDISIHRQYSVYSFSDNNRFQEAISRTGTEKVRLSVVFSRTTPGQTAVAVTPLNNADKAGGIRAIYIYTPNNRKRKGTKKWTRSSKNGLPSRF